MPTLICEKVSMPTPFGDQLKKRRIDAKMSLDDLAASADVSKTYLNNIERGERNPPSKKIVKRIALALDWRFREAIPAAGYIYDEEDDAETDDTGPIVEEPFHDELQKVVGLYGRVMKNLPPGPVRERYMKKLEATAEADFAMLVERLEPEE